MKKVIFVVVTVLIICGWPKSVEGNPLGSEENPIMWWFVPTGEKERLTDAADSLAKLLYEKTGLYFETNVATKYAGVIEALSSKPLAAHIACLATFAYIFAADRGVAEAALVSVRFGKTFYNAQIFVNANSGASKITDLAGKTFARPDPLSTSGWIIPMLTMRAAGIDPEKDLKEIVDAGSHRSVVEWVYYGDVDAGSLTSTPA